MPGAHVPPTRVDLDQARIGVRQAAAVWLIAWLVGNLLGSAVVSASGYTSAASAPVWVTMASAVCLWTPMLAGLWVLSDRFGRGRPADDFGLRFRVVDLVGVPVGVLAQLVVVRLVYWPLERGWPDTFSRSRV
ncbi:MAG: hypothetical protein ACXV3B_09500, partial [Ilumatobacteraceae bacterium]